MDENNKATSQYGDTDEVKENKLVIQLNSEKDSDDKADEDESSELEDKYSKFGYRDLKKHPIEGKDDYKDDSDDASGINLSAKDRKGATDNVEDYDDYEEYENTP
ncbi:hypothetical protein BDR06DRAFT_1006531 [Suillus hirtellus]|nr:hypothetical protein BDR06DRAFT_1006531 [Suillus hirtellus]